MRKSIDLVPYRDTWAENDPHARFKAEVRNYSIADPVPALEGLSDVTGIPVPSLARYVLVKWAASAPEALLEIGPIVLTQLNEHIRIAEEIGTDDARLRAYEALKAMIHWIQSAE